ncbi:hypothetical protein ACQ4LE_000153 [Meloidogyne hapla]|uniref:RING-type domain-containing protein n=1 Tax=Meloidogyne hapla TaxID=6305 RepID=A0A1I8C2C3_MELHA
MKVAIKLISFFVIISINIEANILNDVLSSNETDKLEQFIHKIVETYYKDRKLNGGIKDMKIENIIALIKLYVEKSVEENYQNPEQITSRVNEIITNLLTESIPNYFIEYQKFIAMYNANQGKMATTCSTCHAPYVSTEPIVELGCGHLHHLECLVKWVHSENGTRFQCPLCRAVISRPKEEKQINNSRRGHGRSSYGILSALTSQGESSNRRH